MTTISSGRTDDESPSEAIKERMIDDFREFSGIDRLPLSEKDKRGMATDFLAQVKWDSVDVAVDNYLMVYGENQDAVVGTRNAGSTGESSGAGSSSLDDDEDGLQSVPVVKSAKLTALEVTLDSSDEEDTASPSKKMKRNRREVSVITYNTNGSNSENRSIRTDAICDAIRCTNADIVFLQDMVSFTADKVKSALSDLYVITSSEGNPDKGDNKFPFTVSLFQKKTVQLISHRTIDYEMTSMARTMLTANVVVNAINLNLINTHFEGTNGTIDTRMKQFEECYNFVESWPKDEPVILAGDMVMNDEEMNALGGIPPEFIDAWQASGKKQECKGTLTGQPGSRQDWMLLRDSEPSKIVPVLFNLIGSERIKPQKCFPSDHYGILCVFNTSSLH